MIASFKKYILNFKNPSGTSRGVLTTKETYLIRIVHEDRIGYGETGLFRGLSVDDVPDYEQKLQWACDHIHKGIDYLWNELLAYPSIQFGIEQAFYSLQGTTPFELFQTDFYTSVNPIAINGLVWMGDYEFMNHQIQQKLAQGFTTIKLKIGALDFGSELKLLEKIRSNYDSKQITIRVDANGAFSPVNALQKLKELSVYDLHSIEQPIKQGQISQMAKLCAETPVPIALDEELIDVCRFSQKRELLEAIMPQYIILKPSLVGRFRGSDEWIQLANELNIPFWITSALESNIGLNAICQYTSSLGLKIPQGLGTGGLFTNNIDSPLCVSDGHIFYNQQLTWDLKKIENEFRKS